ncbi:sensor histidine kinase [Phenylobacterium montanum]|uniref:histidine kinase n=1 Tax=Phenylobacterium montanum TaxID=2823693 RepID=A0A975IWF6_9CAUL|nr:histidine kinase dimerization/phosphoacceptor domain -containing protein [Caulobacter sp. S6]QUD89790.1 PAS domain-containing protein [Caulobacter sp. S6]
MIREEILDGIGDATYGLAADWTVTFFNRQAEHFFGYDRKDVVGRSLWETFPAAQETKLADALRQAMRTREAIHLDLLSPTTGKYAETRIFPLKNGGLGVSWRDITDRKKLETALKEAVENQDMLFRELAHRVTNNFQEVAARVTLQGRQLEDPIAREMCEKMASSIRCMALVHRRLYRNQAHIDEQDLGEYLRALCEDLSSGLPDNITLSAVTEPGLTVSVDVATTVGMMVAELVTNSRKYAWEPGASGRMIVTMRRDGGVVEVELWDDGKGVPQGMDLRKSAGLGLKLLGLQIRRLDGTFTHRNVEGGAIFLLRFPTPNRDRPPHPGRAVESRLRTQESAGTGAEAGDQVFSPEPLSVSAGVEDWLNALDGVCYLVAKDGTILAVGDEGWTNFGRDLGSAPPKTEMVVGRLLFDMIADPEAKSAFRAVHRRVATLATRALTYEYRCDAPDLERLMKMSVSALTCQERLLGVLYQSTLLSAKERVPLAFLSSREAAREEERVANLPIVTTCQFCANVTTKAWRGEWVKPTDYYRRGGSDAVRISQGICPECARARLAPLLGK